MAAAGDVNNDGYDDVIVGAKRLSAEAPREGRAYVYLGSPAGLATEPAWIADPTDQEQAYFGISVAGAGDVNGDGYADVIVGASMWDGEVANEGRAYVYLGNETGLGDEPWWTADPTDQGNPRFGTWVAGGGDVDANGFAEVAIGAWEWGLDIEIEGRVYVYHGVSPCADVACSDGNVCNGQESCQHGVCEPGTPLNCDDGDPCTHNDCDPLTGCVNTPDGSCAAGGGPIGGADGSSTEELRLGGGCTQRGTLPAVPIGTFFLLLLGLAAIKIRGR